MRDLLRAATAMRLTWIVLVGDEKHLDGVDAGKHFGQLMKAGLQTAVLDEIRRQRYTRLQSTLEGEIKAVFKKLGDNVTEVERDKIVEEAAQRWLALPHSEGLAAGVIAPTRALRDRINRIIRDELAAQNSRAPDSRIVSRGHGPAGEIQ